MNALEITEKMEKAIMLLRKDAMKELRNKMEKIIEEKPGVSASELAEEMNISEAKAFHMLRRQKARAREARQEPAKADGSLEQNGNEPTNEVETDKSLSSEEEAQLALLLDKLLSANEGNALAGNSLNPHRRNGEWRGRERSGQQRFNAQMQRPNMRPFENEGAGAEERRGSRGQGLNGSRMFGEGGYGRFGNKGHWHE